MNLSRELTRILHFFKLTYCWATNFIFN